MSKDELYMHFYNMFPSYETSVVGYRKTGSKMISLSMMDGSTLVFIYISPTNWSFGTQPWRRRPPPVPKIMKGFKAEVGKINELKS